MPLYSVETYSAAWFTHRLGIATASKFGDIIAKRKKGDGELKARADYRKQLVIERLTGRPLEHFVTPAMATGMEREPFAVEAYEVHTGTLAARTGFYRHDELEAGGTPDRLLGDDGVLEIKCPTLSTHHGYLLDNELFGMEYAAQVQGYLWLTGKAWADLVSYSPEYPRELALVILRIERSEVAIAGIQLEVAMFMEEVRRDEAALRAVKSA